MGEILSINDKLTNDSTNYSVDLGNICGSNTSSDERDFTVERNCPRCLNT